MNTRAKESSTSGARLVVFAAVLSLLPSIASVAPGRPGVAWGLNVFGQLGDGTNADSNMPVQAAGLNGVLAVSGGGSHSLALRTDGTVRAWGNNTFGQLGDGTNVDSNAPVIVTGLNGVVAVAAGGGFSLALKGDGTVWSWGENTNGQLGDGTNNSSNLPVQVVDAAGGALSGVTAIAAGGFHGLALQSDPADVLAWGFNASGQLGDGTNVDSNVPVAVIGINGTVVGLGAGAYHSLAVRANGSVRSWGENFFGQLGDGTNVDRNLPVTVVGLGGVMAVDGGGNHSVALRNNGTVRTWGFNGQGQLGDGTNANSNVPVAVAGLGGVRAVWAGFYHCVAQRANGTARAWGGNTTGQLGDGTNNDSNVPVVVLGLGGIRAIGAGSSHSLAGL